MQSMPYSEAMEKYGSDKPDIRFGLEHMNVTHLFVDSDFGVFSSVAKASGLIKAIFVPASLGTFSRKELDGFTNVVKPHGGKGVAFFKVESSKPVGGISKFVSEDILKSLQEISGTSEDGTWLFFADANHDVAHACADAVRRHLGASLNLIEEGYKFLWVYDFPLFEWDDEENRLTSIHHPFTSPHFDDIKHIEKSPLKVSSFFLRG